jgi:hypothetical protein
VTADPRIDPIALAALLLFFMFTGGLMGAVIVAVVIGRRAMRPFDPRR